jgi:LmbE family N-acetylglucosaminyl deacetylase
LGGGIDAHRPAVLLLWSADAPDHWEDISGYLDTKVAALLCHSSQTETTMGNADRDDASRLAFADKIAGWAERTGAPVGLQQAEAFKRIEP